MTGFWIYMLIMCLLIPALMIGFGKYFMKGGPRQVNSTFGYRTTRSMKNQETWRFAHQYSGKIWLSSGLALLPISIVAILFVYGKSVDITGIAGLIIVIAQIIVMVCAIPLTEAALKRNFDTSIPSITVSFTPFDSLLASLASEKRDWQELRFWEY